MVVAVGQSLTLPGYKRSEIVFAVVALTLLGISREEGSIIPIRTSYILLFPANPQ